MSFSTRLVFVQLPVAAPTRKDALGGKPPEVDLYAMVYKCGASLCSTCHGASRNLFESTIAEDWVTLADAGFDDLAALTAQLNTMIDGAAIREQGGAPEGDLATSVAALEAFGTHLNEMHQVVHERLKSLRGKQAAPADRSADRPVSVPQAGPADRRDVGADPPAQRP